MQFQTSIDIQSKWMIYNSFRRRKKRIW